MLLRLMRVGVVLGGAALAALPAIGPTPAQAQTATGSPLTQGQLMQQLQSSDPSSGVMNQSIAPYSSNATTSSQPGTLPGGNYPVANDTNMIDSRGARSLQDLTGTDGMPIVRPGSPTESYGGVYAPGPLGDVNRGPATAVFGAGLFTRQALSVSDAPNPNYIIVPGDRVSVHVWGALEAELQGQVDPNGNLYMPNLGPIRLAGTRAGDLQAVIERAVRQVYTQQVQVYASLISTQRIGVFVTGFVRIPGRYGGSAADSVLDYLVRAGGVDPARGSFRDISVERGGRTIANVDLYRFLLDGRLPPLRLQEGDTILVGKQRAVVGADGAVRNNYLFEVPGRVMSGRELIDLARPLPSATNVVIRGNRNGQPYSRYATVAELPSITLSDQDSVTFINDTPAPTIRVTVEGSRLGPSVLIANQGTLLCQMLDYIAVDPQQADTGSVFLLRPSLAAQQRRSIDEALARLERQLYMAVSPTTGVATIRASEAQLVSSYIMRARRIQPDGRLVVTDSAGHCAPMRLQDGDVIVIPVQTQTVMVSGEVLSPRAVLWQPKMTFADYVARAGGFSPRGSMSTLMIRRANGELILDPTQQPRPGDELIALPKLDPKTFQVFSDIFTLVYQMALSAAYITNF